MGARFTARYDSNCNDCHEPIYEGDEAGYVDGYVCCESCCDLAEDDEL